ncbi:class I SAM-dependent methyltransferase [Nannocystaceae bacterium ST9]
MLETLDCYYCGSARHSHFIDAQEDLTGKPGTFTFVRCDDCGLVFQNPRLDLDAIKFYYDDEYIAHRKKTDWGPLAPLYEWAMSKHDRDKDALVHRYVGLGRATRVLDVGCAVGSFLIRLGQRYGCRLTGVDFEDCSHHPGFEAIDFRHGLFYEQDLPDRGFDLITMWHFLEHDYDPLRSLATARDKLADEGRLVIEVPRLDSVSFRLFGDRWPGLQAPQHTVLYDRAKLLAFVRKAGLDVVEYLPYGAFPPYFYLFCGTAFKLLAGKGLDLDKMIYPYFAGQLALAPVLAFERRLNLAMQTVVCRRRA